MQGIVKQRGDNVEAARKQCKNKVKATQNICKHNVNSAETVYAQCGTVQERCKNTA